MLINTNKSKCLHFRINRTKETSFFFTIGSNRLEEVYDNKYSGVKSTHTDNFTLNAENLGKAGGEPLGKLYRLFIITKILGLMPMRNCFTPV